jgi:tetratricopeptide (TPR) repeat protein
MSPRIKLIVAMTYSKFIIFAAFCLLSACSHLPKQAAIESVPHTVPSVPQAIVETPAPNLPNQPLSALMLYQFLLGDIAVQRGMPELGAQAYLELAHASRDPRVARRAAQIAIEAHTYDRALNALKLWQELEPLAPQATQMQMTLLVGSGRLAEATPQLRDLLNKTGTNQGLVFMQTHALLQHVQDKRAALVWLQSFSAEFPAVAEGHWAVAQLAAVLEELELAQREVAIAINLRPDWDQPAVLEAQIWMSRDATKALALLKKYLEAHPDNYEARLYYARALLEQKLYAPSREQFQLLLIANPASTEVAFAIALLSLQLGDLDRAEKELRQSLVAGNKDAGTVHYYLAQLHEARKDEAAATAEYHEVNTGEYVFAARLREAQLLYKSAQLDAALTVLHHAPATLPPQQVNLILIEAQMLREAQQHEASFEVLTRGLEKFPKQPQILFETAMTADKLGKLALFEQLMRKLIAVAPDAAQAYNALGYSFLERNVRIAEGMKLVEKAYELAPNDAAIIDSLGWGHFRLGALNKSVEFLRRAFALNPDPEIAAHLGEVLWKSGQHDEAIQLLQDALKNNPDNKILAALLKKYTR